VTRRRHGPENGETPAFAGVSDGGAYGIRTRVTTETRMHRVSTPISSLRLSITPSRARFGARLSASARKGVVYRPNPEERRDETRAGRSGRPVSRPPATYVPHASRGQIMKHGAGTRRERTSPAGQPGERAFDLPRIHTNPRRRRPRGEADGASQLVRRPNQLCAVKRHLGAPELRADGRTVNRDGRRQNGLLLCLHRGQ
jgi:hypothetical protein